MQGGLTQKGFGLSDMRSQYWRFGLMLQDSLETSFLLSDWQWRRQQRERPHLFRGFGEPKGLSSSDYADRAKKLIAAILLSSLQKKVRRAFGCRKSRSGGLCSRERERWDQREKCKRREEQKVFFYRRGTRTYCVFSFDVSGRGTHDRKKYLWGAYLIALLYICVCV